MQHLDWITRTLMSWLLGEGYDIRNGVKLVSKRKKKAMKPLIKKQRNKIKQKGFPRAAAVGRCQSGDALWARLMVAGSCQRLLQQ